MREIDFAETGSVRRFVEAIARRYFTETSQTVAIAYTFPERRNGHTRLETVWTAWGRLESREQDRLSAIGFTHVIRAKFSDAASGKSIDLLATWLRAGRGNLKLDNNSHKTFVVVVAAATKWGGARIHESFQNQKKN